jgi:decaprenyl-phosphate phosphoribosyltransferase
MNESVQVATDTPPGVPDAVTAPVATSPAGTSMAAGLLRLARPKQWAKNVLVFAAPGAAGVLDQAEPLTRTVLAFVCFCLVASGTYFLNDVRDVEADRRHPTKQRRPVAAGIVPVGVATAVGVALLAVGIALAFAVTTDLGITVSAYVALTTAYSTVLKHIAVVDLVAVSAGFVLRAVAGATATGVPISEWFFIVASFGSLFMVTGKRGAEAAELGDDMVAIRPSLASYTPAFVAYLRSVATSGVLLAYCLWAFEKAEGTDASVPWYQLSIVPFALGVLRYALILDQGKGSAPEDVVLSDRILQVIGFGWAVVFGLGVYAT